MTVRATRSQSKPAAAPIKSKKPTTRKTNPKAKVATQPTTNSRKRKAAEAASHDHSDSDIDPEADSDGDDPDNDDDNHKPSSSESESEADEGLESDALDEDTPPPPPKRRKRASPVKASSTSKTSKAASPLKKRKTKSKDSDDEDDVYEDDLEEGQEVVGRVVQAPKTGHVPPGQISQNTMDFLSKLADPKYNDRTWFKLNDPVFRLAENEFKAFIDAFTDVLSAADPEIPPLPPRDVIHRIYRDVRFSNDKTPYKRSFSASFSRSGRKGKFAGYHVSIRPGQSMIAAGTWCPDKNELQTIRAHILRSPARLRRIISAPAFTKLFGPAEPLDVSSSSPKESKNSKKCKTAAGRVIQNIFGREDELKYAPKGIAKDHKHIDLLKCRSFAVAHRFTDKEVLEPGFKDTLGEVVEVMRPFVRCLNDMMTIPPDDNDDHEEDDDEGGGGDGHEEEVASDGAEERDGDEDE